MLTYDNHRTVIKKATNVSLSENLLSEARELSINISKAAEAGLAQEIARRRTELWLRENKKAIDSSNDYVEQNGLPLKKYRMF